MNSAKTVFRFLLLALGTLVMSMILGVLLMWQAYRIPVSPMSGHMTESAKIFEKEGLYPNIPFWAYSILDNWTDAIMLEEAAYENKVDPLLEAMAVSRENTNTGIPVDSLINKYLYGQSSDWTETYERYWHGYLILLKPLMLVTDYSGLRIINAVLQPLLLLCISYLLYRQGFRKYIVPFILSVLCIRLVAIIFCLGFCPEFYMFTIGTLLVLLLNRTSYSLEKNSYLFLLIGIATGFFGVLAYPIVTFGIPAITLLIIVRNSSWKESVRWLFWIGLFWLLGYGGMWAGKWLCGTIVTGQNYFESALNQIAEVTGTDRNFSYGYVVYITVSDFIRTPMIIPVIAYAIYLLVAVVKERNVIFSDRERTLSLVVPMGLMVLFPLLYIFVMKRHVGIHHFLFENKVLMISVFSLLSLLTSLKLLGSPVDQNSDMEQ